MLTLADSRLVSSRQMYRCATTTDAVEASPSGRRSLAFRVPCAGGATNARRRLPSYLLYLPLPRPRGRHPPRGPPPAKYSRRRRYLARRAPQRDSWHRRPLWVPAFPTQGLDRAREAFQRRRDLSLRASDDGAPQTRTLGRSVFARRPSPATRYPAGLTRARREVSRGGARPDLDRVRGQGPPA